ncbi:c-type cytochrome [bacterium]|nr:MAG: c-type cytochrome [bacterium]
MAARVGWMLVLLFLAIAVPGLVSAQAPAGGDAALGARLFSGAVRMQNGGTPCIACHSAGAAGGTYGPDLTTVFTRYGGAKNLEPVLATIAFPSMQPVFARHPLTAAERADVIAYLGAVASAAPQRDAARFPLLGLLFAIVALVAMAVIWRKRLTGVRRALVSRSTR